MGKHNISVPDIGGAHDVDVIEILVKPGDRIAVGNSTKKIEKVSVTVEAIA